MKKIFMVRCAAIAIIMAVLFCSCNDTANNVSHYTPDSKNDTVVSGRDTVHSSAGLANTGRGHEIFLQRCSACHGVNGDARNNNAENLQLTRLDSIGIATTIRHGRGTMPMFDSEVLTDADVAQVEMYVRTLRK
jgi:cytochrome c5